MKKFLCCFGILPLLLSSGALEDAERLFQQGKFTACEHLLEKNSDLKLTPAQRLKRQAMLEYISGCTPDRIAANVKKAGEIAAHRNWLASDILNHAAFLICRAEGWKSRGIPEYQDLSEAAAKLLSRLNDGANPEIAIKQIVLQTRNMNLNGEYDEPVRRIQNALRLYYPAKRHAAEQKRTATGEILLLILLGEQFSGQSASARGIQRKADSLAAAAEYYLKAHRLLAPGAGMYGELSDRLCRIREILRLMGCHLSLPRHIRTSRPISVSLVDEMLRTRRFQDVILFLENKPENHFRLRYALALSAVGQTERAVSVVKTLPDCSEPDLLLRMARNAVAAGKEDDAACFLKCFLDTSPHSSDALPANELYVNILMKQKKYLEGADAILRSLNRLSCDPERRESLSLLAARCCYLGGKYAECIRLCREIAPREDCQLLQAKAELKISDYPNALNRLKKLIRSPTLSEEQLRQTMILAVSCASACGSEDAGPLLEAFLKRFPRDRDMSSYAYQLLDWYRRRKVPPAKYENLAAYYCRHAENSTEVAVFVLACADQCAEINHRERILRNLLARTSFTASELNRILERIVSDELKLSFLNRFKIPFENTPEVCRLYLTMAHAEFSLRNYEKAGNCLNLLLRQRKIYRYQECGKLLMQIRVKSGNEPEARKICQDLLRQELDTKSRRLMILALAESWARSGDYKKAIASAWTAVPPDGRGVDPDDTRTIRRILNLIVHHARKIGSPTDWEEAKELIALTGQ